MRWLVVMVVVLGACSGGGSDTSPSDAATVDAPTLADAATVDAPPPDASVVPGAPPLGLCRDDWCWVYPRPQGNTLGMIWGTADDDVWVSADNDTLLHYDGSQWEEFVVDVNSYSELWGTATDDFWVAGGDVYRWDGAFWSLSLTLPDLEAASALGGTGPDDVWTTTRGGAGLATRAWQWDGSNWTERPVPTPRWYSITLGGTTGSGETVSVSDEGGIAKWLGTAWGIAEAGTRPARAAAVVDGSHVVIVEDSGDVSFWDGTGWTTNSPPVAANWSQVAATSFDDVWVQGFDDSGSYYYHWNGTSWTDAPGNTTRGRLWVSPSGDLWVAHGNAQVNVWNGAVWSGKTVGDNYGHTVWGTAEDDIWIVSRPNATTHWDGTAWSEVSFPFQGSYRVGRIWGSAPDDYWIAGGRILSSGGESDRYMFHWDGTEWTAEGPFGTEWRGLEGFTAVWGAASDDAYAVSPSAVYHYDGTAWAPVADLPVPDSSYRDVFGTASDDVYVLEGPALWHWNGTEWSSKATPVEVDRGWANSPSDLWLGSSGSTGIVHYDGTFFTTCCGRVLGSPMGTASEMFAVSRTANEFYIIRWGDGFLGETSMTPAFFRPTGGAWLSPSGRLYAAGDGLVVHIP